MDLSIKQHRKNVLEGLNYLRRHALEAHRAGDGTQVLHYSTVALNKSVEFGKNHPNSKLEIHELRWAYILGMYSLVNTTFLQDISASFKHVHCDNKNDIDSQIIDLLFKLLSSPHQAIDLPILTNIPMAWWKKRNRVFFEEDSIAMTFVIELIWFRNPLGNEWKSLFTNWLINMPQKGPHQPSLMILKKRLEFQAGFFDGTAFNCSQKDDLPITDTLHEKIFHGWVAFYNFEREILSSITDELKYKISFDKPTYVPFFYLLHASRLERKDKENTSVSYSRLLLAQTHSSAQVFNQTRIRYRDSEFGNLALAGFPNDGLAHKRISCIRTSMLISLQALRTWDIGTWHLGMKRSAISKWELGAHGDEQAIVGGILDAVKSLFVPTAGQSPHFDRCLLLLDALSIEDRSTVVERLLLSPPREWRSVHTILNKLSDAIPEYLLTELALWSLKVESTDLLKNSHIHTFINIWDDILPVVPQKTELIELLAPAIRKVISDSNCWQLAHFAIIASIVNGPLKLAIEFSELLISTECKQPVMSDWRFSIAYNVLELRPEVGERILPYLKDNASTPKKLYELELLKKYEKQFSGKQIENDLKFKKTIVERLLKKIDDRRNLPGPTYFLTPATFNDLARLCKWSRSEPELVYELVSAIDSETVLYIDKLDYLKFLGELVRLGPLVQAKKISEHAVRWLGEGITGKSIGQQGGPLSRINFGGFDKYESGLFYLIEECAFKCPELILDKLVGWLPLNQNSYLPEYTINILHIELALLSTASHRSDQTAAILVGLIDTSSLLSIKENAIHVVSAFEYVVTNIFLKKYIKILSQNNIWCKTFLNQWVARLSLLSKNPSPEVRASVARIVRRWIQSDLPCSDKFAEINDQLSKDCRLRVRYAIKHTNIELN